MHFILRKDDPSKPVASCPSSVRNAHRRSLACLSTTLSLILSVLSASLPTRSVQFPTIAPGKSFAENFPNYRRPILATSSDTPILTSTENFLRGLFSPPEPSTPELTPYQTATDLCSRKIVPTSSYYVERIDTVSLSFIIVACILTIWLLILFGAHLHMIFSYVSNYGRAGKLAWLSGVFPVTAVASLVGICVPRAMPIVDILILLYFARCLFSFMELLVELFGGRLEMSSQLRGSEINLRSPPFCCCCLFLPKLKPSVGNIRKLEFLIYQVAVMRPIIYFIKGCLWADRVGTMPAETSPETPVLALVNICSTMTAMWGLTIFAQITTEPLKHYRVVVLVRVMQVLVVLFNLQGNAFNLLVNTFKLISCDQVLPASARANLWHHVLLIVECAIISSAVSWLYRPKRNQVFDLHPSFVRNPHNATRRSFVNGRPPISSPKPTVKSTTGAPSINFSFPPTSPSLKSIMTVESEDKKSSSYSAGYGSTVDSDESSSTSTGRYSRNSEAETDQYRDPRDSTTEAISCTDSSKTLVAHYV